MKKLFLTIITMTGIYGAVQAQVSNPLDIYDNVDLGSSSIDFMYGMYGNWGVASVDAVYSPPPQSWIGTGTSGSGLQGSIFRRYNFQPNTNYKITVGIQQFGTGFPGTNPTYDFKVLLARNVNGSIGPENPSTLPNFNTPRLLYTYTVSNYGSVSPNGASLFNQALLLQFTTGPGEYYDDIVFYTDGNEEVDLSIGCLGINSCPNNLGDLYYSATQIPSGISTGVNVYVGSSYGGSTTLTNSDPNATTSIYGMQSVVVGPNTILSANGSNIVELNMRENCVPEFVNYTNGAVYSQIFPFSCDAPSRSIPATTTNLIKVPDQSSILVFPNPALNHTFSVKNTSDETVQLEFIDLNGRSIDHRTISGNSISSYSFGNLANGIYYLKASGTNYNKVEKIIFN